VEKLHKELFSAQTYLNLQEFKDEGNFLHVQIFSKFALKVSDGDFRLVTNRGSQNRVVQYHAVVHFLQLVYTNF
jgi:hypothetical protein